MPERPKRFYRTWWFRILASVGILAVGYEFYERHVDAVALEQALAEADRRFPGDWRFDDVFAKFPAPTPPEKDPLRILAGWEKEGVSKLYTQPATEEFTRLRQRGPNVRPEPEQLALFRDSLRKAKSYLDEMEPFRETSDVYHPLDWEVNFTRILIPHTQALRAWAAFNSMRVHLALDRGDEKDAVDSLRAIHHSLSWLHREPFLISQLVRIACFHIECGLLETVLGQGEMDPEFLKKIADLIEAEVRVDPYHAGTRIEMGAMDRLLEAIIDGRFALRDLGGDENRESGGFGEWVFLRYYGKRNRANMLREWMDLRSQTEKNPTPAEMKSYFEAFRSRMKERLMDDDRTYVLPRLIFPAANQVYDAKVRFDALGQIAVASIACERFRRDRGAWPTNLEDLAPNYLASVPIDPWDGKPLKLKRRDDGITVYTIGPDFTDNGGKIDRERTVSDGSDVGFELFEPAHRRRPAPPKPVEPEEKD